MAHRTSPTRTEDLDQYRPLITPIVVGFIAVLVVRYAASHFLSDTAAEALKAVTWCVFGAFLYRGAVMAGVFDHLNEPQRLCHRATNDNQKD